MTVSHIPSLLPNNACDVELSLERAMARLEQLQLAHRQLWDPSSCPPTLLPWLAWAVSVDVWSYDYDEATKRQLMAGSFAKHRIKGSRQAMDEAMADLDWPVSIEEWFDYNGQPYCFRLLGEIKDRSMQEADWRLWIEVALAAKNLRSFLERVRLKIKRPPAVTKVYAGHLVGHRARLYPQQLRQLDLKLKTSSGAAAQTCQKLLLYPQQIKEVRAISQTKALTATRTGVSRRLYPPQINAVGIKGKSLIAVAHYKHQKLRLYPQSKPRKISSLGAILAAGLKSSWRIQLAPMGQLSLPL